MKCRRVRKWLVVDGGDLPAAVESHLEKCAECRRFRQESWRVARLVRLKRYERPDPVRAAALRARIVAGAMSPEKSPEGRAAEPAAAFLSFARAALVGLVLVLLGLNLILPHSVSRRRESIPAVPAGRARYADEARRPVPETNRTGNFRNRWIVPVGYRPVSR